MTIQTRLDWRLLAFAIIPFASCQSPAQVLEINSEQRQETFEINESIAMALGWHIITTASGQVLYFHNGGTGGYRSSLYVDITNETAVIILSNVSAFHPSSADIDLLGRGLLGTL